MLVGREAVAAELAALLAEDRSVVVSGEAGIGKTALLRAVAAASGRTVFAGGGLATLSWMAYLPLRRALGRDIDGDPTAVAAEIEQTVGAGVLLVDDAHWADPSTLETLTLLTGRVGVLAGVRRGDPGADVTLDRLCDAGYAEVPLRPLARTEAAEVVRSLRPDLPATSVDRLITRTGGNPLLLRELSATGDPSASLRLALAARLRQLDDVARETFALVALAGRPVRIGALDETGVKSLLDVELLVRDGDEVAVRHALLAEVAAAEMTDAARRGLHARIARAVADDGEAAVHHRLAGEAELAHDAAMRAAGESSRPAERAAHLALAAETASGPAADQLRLRAAQALEEAHDWTGMLRVLDLIDPADTEALAEANLLRARGAWTAGDSEGLRHGIEAGLELVRGSGTPVELRLLIERTRVPLFLEGDLTTAVRDSRAALDLARSAGTYVSRALYLYGTAVAAADQPGGLEALVEAIPLARADGDLATEFLAANNLVSFHESAGDPVTGRELCREYIDRARALGLGEWERNFQVALIELEFHAGAYDRVIPVAENLLASVLRARTWDQVLEILCIALIDVGRIDEALRRVDAAQTVPDYKGDMQVAWVRTEAALWGGNPTRALEYAEAYLHSPEEDPNYMFGVVSRSWALFDLGRDPGPPPGPQARRMLYGVPNEVDGLGLLHRGSYPRASAAFTAAATMWAPYHRRGELRCLWGAAEATRRSGDPATAIRLLEELERRVQAHGMLPLLGRVHQSLRAAGRRRSAPRTRSAGSTLTGRQGEILALVRDGLTNAQIASRLGISRHTVVAQLASASAKLGATGRAQAAVLAAQGSR